MISYFELLKMIKEGNIPEKIRVHLTSSTSKIYYAEYDGNNFSHYFLDDEVDESYRCYLAECFLESSMFDKSIEIIEDKIEKIQLTNGGLTLHENNNDYTLSTIHKSIINKINEIIDKLNSIEQE